MMLTEMIGNLKRGIYELEDEKASAQAEIEHLLEFDDTDETVEIYEAEIKAIDGEIEGYRDQLKRYESMLVTYGKNAKLW